MQTGFIPPESGPLAALKEVRRQTITAYTEAANPGWDVTLDVDVRLVETTKENARYCYGVIKPLAQQKCAGQRPSWYWLMSSGRVMCHHQKPYQDWWMKPTICCQ